MRRIIIFLLIFSVSAGSWAEVFKFKYNKGEKYKILSVVNENVYIDGILSYNTRILNKISAEVTDVNTEGTAGEIEADFMTTEEYGGAVPLYSVSQEYFSRYWRDSNGNYDIGPDYFMPVVRNVPVFDGSDYQPGDFWSSRGYEVHDFRKGYGISEPFSYPVNVRYQYLGKGEKDGRIYDLISIFYTISHRTSDFYSRYPFYPVRITGYSDQTLYWDNEAGKPYAYEEEFSIQVTRSDGVDYEFAGTASAVVTESELMDKARIASDINERLRREQMENAVADVGDDGVTITLDNISFGADSAALKDTEKRKLDIIIDILRNYPDRDVLITGHTALAGTPEGRLELSRQRAASVAEYFLASGVKSRDQLVITGKGADAPVADNSTPEGMSRNRRVEITIVEN